MAEDDRPPIETRGLRKSYGSVDVLRGVDLTVRRGTMTALLGPNGAGKTTTIRILSTLVAPDSGTATVNGFDVVDRPRQVRASIGLTGQYSAVDKLLTGEENLRMMGRLNRLSRSAARRRAGELLEQFDLVEASSRPVKTYSGGMRRRLDLAVSLIAAPPVLFLDEPTTGLDPRSRTMMWDAIRDLLDQGVTVLLTTQYLEEADRLAGRVVVLHDGTAIADGTPEELKQRVGHERLELAFADPGTALVAVRALGSAAALTGDGLRIDVPLDSVAHLRRVLDELDLAGAGPESVGIAKPTLDDVFLSLTGGPAVAPDRAPTEVAA